MTNWQQLIPRNKGGGRHSGPPGANFASSGDLILTRSACTLLGDPDRVLVDRCADMLRIRPTTSGNAGGYSVIGGGGSSYRVKLRLLAKSQAGAWLIGKMQGVVEDGALILWRDGLPRPANPDHWLPVKPESSQAGGRRPAANVTIYADGRVILAAKIANELGYGGVRVWVDPATFRFRLIPSTRDDPAAYSLLGDPGRDARFSISEFVKEHQGAVGIYRAGRISGGIGLIKIAE